MVAVSGFLSPGGFDSHLILANLLKFGAKPSLFVLATPRMRTWIND